MATTLENVYSNTKVKKKRPFNVEEVSDYLMSNGVDVSNIIHTPETVMINLPKNDIIKRGIIQMVTGEFEAKPLWKNDLLILHPERIIVKLFYLMYFLI